MSSLRSILFLVLTAGIGILAFLTVRGGTVLSPERVDAESRSPIPGRVVSVGPRSSAPTAPEEVELRDFAPTARVIESAGAIGARPETTVIHPLEVVLTLGLSEEIAVPEGAQPIRTGANARLSGTVLGTSGQPLPATVRFLHGPNEGRVLRTDSAGRFGAGDLWQGLSLIRIETPSGMMVEREVPLARLSTRDLHISFANTSNLAGTVQDVRGAPIPDAEVTVDGRRTMTDSSGIFMVAAVPAGNPLVTVRKDGYAFARRSAGLGMRTSVAPEQFVVTLQESADLTITIGRRAGAEGSSYAVLMPAAGPSHSGGDTGFPWFMVNPIEIPASGSATVSGLAPGPLAVTVFHRGARALPARRTVHLDPGRTAVARVDLEPAPSIIGTVLEDGVPVSGALVSIEAADQTVAATAGIGETDLRSLLQVVLPSIPTAQDQTTTNEAGRFQFSRDPKSNTTYYVRARSKRGDLVGAAALVPGASEVTIELQKPVARTGTLVIDLPTRHQGLPVEVTVNGEPRERMVLRATEPLRIEGLEYGQWMGEAQWRGETVLMQTPFAVSASPPRLGVRSLPQGAIAGQSAEERRRAGLE